MISPRPAVETVVYGRWRTVFGGAVLPATAALENMNDAADDPPVIHPTSAGLVLRKVRLDRRPSLIIQPEKLPQSTLQGSQNALESRFDNQFKFLIGF